MAQLKFLRPKRKAAHMWPNFKLRYFTTSSPPLPPSSPKLQLISASSMAKTRNRRLVKKYPAANLPPKIEKQKPNKKNNRKNYKTKPPKPASRVSDSDSESDPQIRIQTLLEPFSKDQLVTLVTDLSLSHSPIVDLIKSAADQDVSHRKIFIHGLGWDATHQVVDQIFGAYGEIEDLKVVNDRATGKCKGYAFLTYKSRKSATKLLKNPRVEVGNRTISCQLAAEGPTSASAGGAGGVVSEQHFPSSDYPQRKVYVNNVPAGASADRLRAFFQQFGEIESGPKGFDPSTGKFRGYAIFVYRTVEGARKVLQEPYKVFDGSRLHCQKAAEGKSNNVGGAASITTSLQPMQPQMLAAAAAAQQQQSMAMFGQQAGLVNPFYGGGMIPNPNLNALMGGYYGMIPNPNVGLGSYGGLGAGAEGGGILQGLQYLYPSGQALSPLRKAPGNSSGGGGYSPI